MIAPRPSPVAVWIGMILCALLGFAGASRAVAGVKTRLKVEPGAKAMSDAERALAPDAASGAEHGVILVDETERYDSPTGPEVTHHFRAKILSNEGRRLGDVSIPSAGAASDMKKWWGWTILPDGRVMTLARQDLKETEIVRSRGWKLTALKGALPGVAPGCVIDYGYSMWDKSLSWSLRVTLQKDWPVKEFSYRWVPMGMLPGAFRVYRTAGLSVETTHDGSSVLVTGRDLPAVPAEPWSPPDSELRAAATFYYYGGELKPREYWDSVADRFRDRARSFAKEKQVMELIASMRISAGAELPARLKAAYDWIGSRLANTDLLTAEQVEASAAQDEKEGKPGGSIKGLLEKKEGPGWQLDQLFIGVARALGAEAEVVLAVDRTDHYLDPALLSEKQIDTTLVAVRAPGEPDDKVVVVDPGSGLPYGQIPWWFSGLNGIAAGPRGARDVMLWPSDPRDNSSETTGSISFDAAGGTAQVRWTRTGTGQQGLSERRALRPMTPEKRRKRLEEYCGGGGAFEVTRAEAPKLHEMTAGFLVECEATLTTANIHAGLDEYRFVLDGPWFPELPEFPSATRVHPVVFPFPRVDHVILEIESPEGMSDRTVPAPVRIESPYGNYVLTATATPKGLRVERLFSLVALGVPQKEYEALRAFLAGARRADQTVLEFRRTGGAS